MQSLMQQPHSQQFTAWLEQIEQRQTLRARLLHSLPASAHTALLDAVIQTNTLHLTVTSAAWASRLRLMTPLLIQICQQPTVSQLKVHVRTPAAEPKAKTFRTPMPVSIQVIQQLDALAHTLDNDDPLACALQRLSELLSHSSTTN